MITRITLLSLAVVFLSACQPSIPKDALLLSPESLADRQMQTRRFETSSNQIVLSATSAVLQDLGFNLDESESTLGVLVGSKRRDATSAGQIAGSILVAALFGVYTPVDKEQIIRASIVMREITPAIPDEEQNNKLQPSANQTSSTQVSNTKSPGQSTVRVTFQRVVISTNNQITQAEQISDPEMYNEFFDKLSQSVFLEAHEI